MLNTQDILETIQMIRQENLDIRTITMGISLFDCISDDEARLNQKIYDKITRSAENLVATGCAIEKDYGVPIVNKRVSVTPISLVGGGLSPEGYVRIAHTLQKAAEATGINFIGGYSALVHKGMTQGDRNLIEAIPVALAETEMVCSSVNVATTKAGINMDAIRLMGKTIKRAAELTKDRNSIGCAKLVVFANVPEDNPFMAGAFHGVGEPDRVINVGVSGPGVVSSAIERAGDCDLSQLAELIKKTAFKITRVGQLVASEASRRLGVPMRSDILRRCRRTRTQTKLSIAEKKANVAGAFAVHKQVHAEELPFRHILIIDDVFTTGSTLFACFEALRTVFPASVRISVATLGFAGEV